MTDSHCSKNHAAQHQGLLFHLAIIILLIQDPGVYGSFLVKSHCFDGLMMCSAAFGVLGNFLKLALIFSKIEYSPVYEILIFDIKLEQMVLGGSITLLLLINFISCLFIDGTVASQFILFFLITSKDCLVFMYCIVTFILDYPFRFHGSLIKTL